MLEGQLPDKAISSAIALLLYQKGGNFYVKNIDQKTPLTLMLDSFKTSEDIRDVLDFISNLSLPDNAKVTMTTIKNQMEKTIITKKQKRLTAAFDNLQMEEDNHQNPDSNPESDDNNNTTMATFRF